MFKKIFFAIVISIISGLGVNAQAVKGEKTLGPKLGYTSVNSSAVAGLTFTYAFSNHFRLAPEIGCAFRNKGKDALLIDINGQFPIPFAGTSKVGLYPLAGLAFNSWATHHVAFQDNVDVTTHISRFGANLGAGFDFYTSNTLRINIEAKYTLIKSYSGVYITAGISYIF